MRVSRIFLRARSATGPHSFCATICRIAGLLAVAICLTGCGTSRSRKATDQLLTSGAVDKTVAAIDFSVMKGRKVYLDTQFIKGIKGTGLVNGNYVISSLRNQIVAAGCLIQDSKEDAEYIIEARVGTLGNDQHEVSYGIPASRMLSTAAAFIPNAPPIPTIPEMSIAKKSQSYAVVKIAVFAYHQKTRRPVWQSGIVKTKSDSQDVWLLGAGPFQSGSIVDGATFAGTRIAIPLMHSDEKKKTHKTVSHMKPHTFDHTTHPREPKRIQHAKFVKPVPLGGAAGAAAKRSQ